MTKLNGWKRIGIIASFVWVLGGAWYSNQDNDKSDAAFIQSSVNIELQCEDSSTTDAQRSACIQTSDDRIAMLSSSAAMSNRRAEAAIFAFTPIPFAWGFVFMVLGLGRWVKRGFAVAAS